MNEKTVVYFEDISSAIPVAKNLDTSLDPSLSIEGDKEEIQEAIRQENISSTKYSIATVVDAD